MKEIYEIDPNFAIVEHIEQPGLVWHETNEEGFTIYGLEESGLAMNPQVYRRIPREVAEQTSEGVLGLHDNTAGGRVRFMTDSPYVAIRVTYRWLCDMPHMPLTGSSAFDMYQTDENGCNYIKTFTPPWNPQARKNGYEAICRMKEGKMRDLTINFPLYNSVESLQIGLAEDAVIEKAPGYRLPDPVVYYGSSITQGGCASRPGNAYQGFVSRALDLDQINLGFSGSGRGEPVMADHIASLKMCAFVLDYDHNAPDPEHLEKTHYPLYKKVRDAHPDIPILCVSRPNYDFSNEPADAMRDVIRATVKRAVEEGDKNIRFLDGETLFGTDFRRDCTVDGAHPNDLGFYRMAQAMIPILKEMLEL